MAKYILLSPLNSTMYKCMYVRIYMYLFCSQELSIHLWVYCVKVLLMNLIYLYQFHCFFALGEELNLVQMMMFTHDSPATPCSRVWLTTKSRYDDAHKYPHQKNLTSGSELTWMSIDSPHQVYIDVTFQGIKINCQWLQAASLELAYDNVNAIIIVINKTH